MDFCSLFLFVSALYVVLLYILLKFIFNVLTVAFTHVHIMYFSYSGGQMNK